MTVWSEATDGRLAQGDYLPGIDVPVIPEDFSESDASISIETRDLVVLTQSCDLVEISQCRVVTCAIHTVERFGEVNPTYKTNSKLNEIRSNRVYGLTLLPGLTDPQDPFVGFIVDFRDLHLLPHKYLLEQASRLPGRKRLQSPYLEDFSHQFGDLFARVALPLQVRKFTSGTHPPLA
jgi:hypothetical protein